MSHARSLLPGATLHHAVLAEAYRRTRGHYPAGAGIGYAELVDLFETDDAMAAAVAEVTYDDIAPILPFTDD